MRRRQFFGLVAGGAAWPVLGHAQRPAGGDVPRIGAIYGSQSDNNTAFRDGLAEAGYVDGKNILIEERLHGSAVERADEFAHEFVGLKCKAIMAGTPYAIRAATKATRTIPIIGVDLESDPVASGLVKSVARPGGNFTGFFLDIPDLGGKQIELLMEAVRQVSRIAVVWDETIGEVQFHAAETAPRPPGVELLSFPIRRVEDFSTAFERAVQARAQGLILLSSPMIFLQRTNIAATALEARMPTISLFTAYPTVGGLMAYGPNFPLLYRQAASYVGKILAGANPGELPIQRPTTFELVINLKTAKALGVDVAPTLLARADQVIE
jgi:putative tryptophan/tyrosine transport system substrate-binding protein